MRPLWTGAIGFGLVNIPVKLYSATQGSELNLDMLDKKDHVNIKFKRVNEKTGKEVPWQSIVKGYISQTGPESFRVTDKKSGKVTTISCEDAARVQKSGLSTGAKIGIGVGIVGGVLVAIALGSLAASGE